MLTFHRENIKDIVLEQPDKIAKDCSAYKLKKHDEIIATVYGGDRFTFIQFIDALFRIDRQDIFFKQKKYLMYNHSTKEFIGEYKFASTPDDCTLYLANGDILLFSALNFHHRLFKPSTQVDNTFTMSYNANNIYYTGRLFKYGGFEGTIESTDENLLLPISAGIFIMEERFRLISERSG